jgi:hypothetical protein
MIPKEIPDYIKREGFAHQWEYQKKDGSTYLLRMARNDFGCWCGYVGLPKGHPCFGMWYDDIHEKYPDLQVHGGLTYSEGLFSWALVEKKGEERRQELDRMIKERGNQTDYWEFGFDCNHFNDIAPLMPSLYPPEYSPEYDLGKYSYITYKTKMWVINETESLARQFEEIEIAAARKKKKK